MQRSRYLIIYLFNILILFDYDVTNNLMQRSCYLINLIFLNYDVNNNLINRLIFDVSNDVVENFIIDQVVDMMTIDIMLINNEFVDVFDDL